MKVFRHFERSAEKGFVQGETQKELRNTILMSIADDRIEFRDILRSER